MINFHAPFAVEDQIDLMASYTGNYVLDFRVDIAESAALINSLGSYVYEGIPLTKILSEYSSSYPKIYNNKVLPKSLVNANGTLKVHDWNKAAAQAIYSDLVIENDEPIPEGSKREVYIQVINANYVVIDSTGNIVSYSPLLQEQINSWKALNDNRNPKTLDLFGTESVVAYAYQLNHLNSSGQVNLIVEGVYPLDLENMKVDFGTIEVTTTAEPVEGEPPPEPVTEIVPKLPPQGLSKLPIYPDDVDLESPVVGFRTTFTPLKPYTDTSNLLTIPTLKIGATPNTYYQGLFQNIIQDYSGKYSFSKSSLGGYVKFERSDDIPKLLLSGIYVGRPLNSTEASLRKQFLSYPESVIQETGVEVLFSYRTKVIETVPENPEDPPVEDILQLSDLYTTPLLSVSAGVTGYQLNTNLWTLSYESESISYTTDRYRIRYEVSDEVTTSIYKFKWESTTESEEFRHTWNFSWESENTRRYSFEYYIRYESELPEFRDYKDFYSLTWDRDLSRVNNDLYKIKYEAEQFRTYKNEWSFKWEISLIDSVIVRPYYLEKYVNGTYIDCISYQVYVDFSAIREYLLTDKFYMYFSNAPKYEMVMFDSIRQPYEGIFLSSVEDSTLDNREGIPERFILLGNYTVDNIDRNNSLSLDIVGGKKQLNECKSYWIPEVTADYFNYIQLMDDNYSSSLPLEDIFVDFHNTDEVELEVVALEAGTCCFIQTSVGSRCSPY